MFSFPVYADELVPFEFNIPHGSDKEKIANQECTFNNLVVPNNAVIYAVGAYAGRETDIQIDQSGHAGTQFDIVVNSKDRPVILILGAYEPSIWNIGWSEGTQILAVFASGYHRQVLAGLDSSVPVLISTYDNQGPCGYFYIKRGQDTALNPRSRGLFGKPVDLVYVCDKAASVVVGDPLSSSDKLVTSSNATPESYRDRSAPLAGKAGLEDAVSKGLIRRATRVDAQRWVDELVASMPTPDVPPIAGQGAPKPKAPWIINAYVVLKPFVYPAGLYGGDAARFFIDHGVPVPTGDPGHSAVYNFNTLICRGALCGY
jgi:hypothetical protein